MKKISFKEMNLSKEILKAIDELGFEEATPIQSEAIPVLMEKKDVIGQAQTGTGKTAAFVIPALEQIKADENCIQVLIICPTRELALQVADDTVKMAKYKKGIRLLPVYGGQSMNRQLSILERGVHIVIGTPGRIMDHMDRGTIDFSDVKFVVLDEADRMLDMGFRDDIELILKAVPTERQTLLFSATMPKAILELAKRYQKNPVTLKITHEILTVPNTEQVYFEVRAKEKLDLLTNLIDLNGLKLSLVFVNTKREVDELVEHLQVRGYSADGMHGDMRQQLREKVLLKFRKGRIEILVATDVAARGLDVDDIDAVFNYDMPQDEESYVHRIGRTGRAGKSGKAFSFVTSKDFSLVKDIQKYIKTKIKLHRRPTESDIEQKRTSSILDEIKKIVTDENLNEYYTLIEKLSDDELTSLDIAAALLKLKFDAENKTIARKNDDDEAPLSSQKTTRLFINMGKKDKMSAGDIFGAITGESGIEGKLIGEIEMFDAFSFVNVSSEIADEVIDALNGIKMKRKVISIEKAKAKGQNEKTNRKRRG